MKEMEAIILAGGFGSRMKEVDPDKQKCLLPIEDKPALGHIMESLVVAFGSVDLKIGVGYKSEQVIDYVNHNKPKNTTVTYIPHVPGTEGWGIYWDMREHVHGAFVAMPGDVLTLPKVYEDAIRSFEENDVDGVVTLSPKLDEVDSHGVGKIENQILKDLKWPPPSEIEEGYLRDMTIWASDKRIFDIIRKYPNPKKSIGHVFMDAMRDKRSIMGNEYDLPWVHMGHPSDLKKPLPRLGVMV